MIMIIYNQVRKIVNNQPNLIIFNHLIYPYKKNKINPIITHYNQQQN